MDCFQCKLHFEANDCKKNRGYLCPYGHIQCSSCAISLNFKCGICHKDTQAILVLDMETQFNEEACKKINLATLTKSLSQATAKLDNFLSQRVKSAHDNVDKPKLKPETCISHNIIGDAPKKVTQSVATQTEIPQMETRTIGTSCSPTVSTDNVGYIQVDEYLIVEEFTLLPRRMSTVFRDFGIQFAQPATYIPSAPLDNGIAHVLYENDLSACDESIPTHKWDPIQSNERFCDITCMPTSSDYNIRPNPEAQEIVVSTEEGSITQGGESEDTNDRPTSDTNAPPSSEISERQTPSEANSSPANNNIGKVSNVTFAEPQIPLTTEELFACSINRLAKKINHNCKSESFFKRPYLKVEKKCYLRNRLSSCSSSATELEETQKSLHQAGFITKNDDPRPFNFSQYLREPAYPKTDIYLFDAPLEIVPAISSIRRALFNTATARHPRRKIPPQSEPMSLTLSEAFNHEKKSSARSCLDFLYRPIQCFECLGLRLPSDFVRHIFTEHRDWQAENITIGELKSYEFNADAVKLNEYTCHKAFAVYGKVIDPENDDFQFPLPVFVMSSRMSVANGVDSRIMVCLFGSYPEALDLHASVTASDPRSPKPMHHMSVTDQVISCWRLNSPFDQYYTGRYFLELSATEVANLSARKGTIHLEIVFH